MISQCKKWMGSCIGAYSKILSRKGLYEFLKKEFSIIPQGSNVLTVGAVGGTNKLLDRHAAKQGFRVISIDIDKRTNPDFAGDICTFDFSENKFDFIVMSEVLEHVKSPADALRNIRNTLADNGKLILSAPFILPIHDRPNDYFRFTRFGLEMLLDDFTDVHIKERNSYFEAIDVLWFRLLQTNAKYAQVFLFLFTPFFLIFKSPITLFLSKVIKTDAMTTGYVATATKKLV